MCLYLVNSQFKNTKEVETILSKKNMTKEKILAMKDNRQEIERQLKVIKQLKELQALGY